MSTPTAERLADGSLSLRFPFDEGINVQLKFLRGRWDPDRQTWVVRKEQDKNAIKILAERFGVVMVVGDGTDYYVDKWGIVTEQPSLF